MVHDVSLIKAFTILSSLDILVSWLLDAPSHEYFRGPFDLR